MLYVSDDVGSILIVIFHHKARHTTLRLSSDMKLDGSTVSRASCVADAVFWQKDMYKCKTNSELMDKLKRHVEMLKIAL